MILIDIFGSLIFLILISLLISTIITVIIPFDSLRKALFFPGVVIHETAHAAVLKMLGFTIIQIDFINGFVKSEKDDSTRTYKRLLVTIAPIFWSWILGGICIIFALKLMETGEWMVSGVLIFIGLSSFASAAPSLQDMRFAFQGENEAITAAIWIIICGLMGYYTMQEQSFRMLQSLKDQYNQIISFGGGLITASLGYLVYRITQKNPEEKEAWIW